jgi:hypothetical protein
MKTMKPGMGWSNYVNPMERTMRKLDKADLLVEAEQVGRENAWITYPGAENDMLWAWEHYVWVSAESWLEDIRTPAELRAGERTYYDVTAIRSVKKSVMDEIRRRGSNAWKQSRQAALEGSEKEDRMLRRMGWDGR